MIEIVIPVHNRKLYTRNCLMGLRKQTYKNFKILVVDDGSTDGTAEMIKSEFPEVYLIKGDGNLWWTRAINLGVTYALEKKADLVLSLNNDTVAPEDFLEKMVTWSVKKPDSLFGAFAIDVATKKEVYGGEVINWKYATTTRLLDKIPPEERRGIHEVSYFSGRGLLIPGKVFRAIGFFDEKRFPHYGADYDFTFRAGKRGFKVFCNYDSKLFIYPEESGNVKFRKRKNLKNYMNHLFSKESGANLFTHWRFTINHCPAIYLPQNLIIGTIRRIAGYWLH